jgi:putative transposase
MAVLRKTFKYRLYPNKAETARLEEWLTLNRELYNAALEERREAYKRAGKTIGLYEQYHALPEVREGRPEFYGIPVVVLRGTLHRLDRAYQAFFRRVKTGQAPGFPRFQGRNRFDSLTYEQVNTHITVSHKRIHLPVFGDVKVVLHRPWQGTIKQITIRRDGEQWYVCLSCVVVQDDPVPADLPAVGIDLGLEKFAVLSTGEQIANPRFLRKAEAKLTATHQHLSRCKRGSNRRHKAKRALHNITRKVRNQRADFCHKQARRLVDTYGTLVLEDLAPANLSRRPKPKPSEDGTGFEHNGAAQKAGLNKSINDAGWTLFRELCTVKAAWARQRVILVPPAYTSQVCSGCGVIRKKELSERWHSCECGTELDRDHNAALNILRLGLNQHPAGGRPTSRKECQSV